MFISGNRSNFRSSLPSTPQCGFLRGSLKNDQDKRRYGCLSSDWSNIITSSNAADTEKRNENVKFPKIVVYSKDEVEFCTGSAYQGKWNILGLTDSGTYKYLHGCKYEGGFEDGRFHGLGTLTYPMGQKLKCTWNKGKMVSCTFLFAGDTEPLDLNTYCRYPERRFHYEHKNDLQPAGKEILTNQQPTRPLPRGMCDVGDGYFNPHTREVIPSRDPAIYKYIDESALVIYADWKANITIATEDRARWILEKCRKGWEEPAEYRPKFYEEWTAGRREELKMIDTNYVAPPKRIEEEVKSQPKIGIKSVSEQIFK